MVGDLEFCLEGQGQRKVTRYGYRRARPVDWFMSIAGRCSRLADSHGNAIRSFQESLDREAGYTNQTDNHVTYVVESGSGKLVIMFHDDIVAFGRDVVVKDW